MLDIAGVKAFARIVLACGRCFQYTELCWGEMVNPCPPVSQAIPDGWEVQITFCTTSTLP